MSARHRFSPSQAILIFAYICKIYDSKIGDKIADFLSQRQGNQLCCHTTFSMI